MGQHPVEKAISEIARGFVPNDNLNNGVRRKRLTRRQIVKPRRPTETVMVNMADKMRAWKDSNAEGRKKKRKRRRGPKVLVATFYDKIR